MGIALKLYSNILLRNELLYMIIYHELKSQKNNTLLTTVYTYFNNPIIIFSQN